MGWWWRCRGFYQWCDAKGGDGGERGWRRRRRRRRSGGEGGLNHPCCVGWKQTVGATGGNRITASALYHSQPTGSQATRTRNHQGRIRQTRGGPNQPGEDQKPTIGGLDQPGEDQRPTRGGPDQPEEDQTNQRRTRDRPETSHRPTRDQP